MKRAIPLSEQGSEQRKRLARLRASGDATTVTGGDGYDRYFADVMIEAPTVTGRSSGSRKTVRPKNRGTKICRFEGCGLEASACGHEQRGRPRLRERKTATLRPYLPRELREFLRRSEDLQLTDILEAVLGSAAMDCWRTHVDQYPIQYCDEEGNPVTRTAYDEIAEKRSRHLPWTSGGDDSDIEWLKRLRPNLGPRFEERVTPSLLARIRSVGRAARQSKCRVKYSDTRFCAYCVQYYMSCLRLVQKSDVPDWQRSSSRKEAKLVKQVARVCFRCKPSFLQRNSMML